MNLIDNALKYSPPGSPVDIKAWAAGKSLTLSVADRGPGLAPGEEARIFEKLSAAKPGPADRAGLGLAICKGIVAAHGGQIQAVNHPQGGALFRISLPLGTPPAGPARRDHDRCQRRSSSGRRRAADAPVPGGPGGQRLPLPGGRHGAGGPGPGRPAQPDVILLDLGLPDMDGLDVTRGSANGARSRSSSSPPGGRKQTRWARSTSAPTTTSPSPSARGSCWPASAWRCAMRPGAGEEPLFDPGGGGWIWPGARSWRGRGGPPHPPSTSSSRPWSGTPGKVVTHRQLLKEVWGGVAGAQHTTFACLHGPAPAQARRGSRPARGTCRPSRAWAIG